MEGGAAGAGGEVGDVLADVGHAGYEEEVTGEEGGANLRWASGRWRSRRGAKLV